MILKYTDFIKENQDQDQEFDLFPTSSEDLLIETLQRYYEILSTKMDDEWAEMITHLGPKHPKAKQLQSRFDDKLLHQIQMHWSKNRQIFREHSTNKESDFYGLDKVLERFLMNRFTKPIIEVFKTTLIVYGIDDRNLKITEDR